MVDYESVPYQKFIDYTENQLFNNFKDFNGIFSIFLYNKKEKKIFLISDRRTQFPVYYFIDKENVIFSTELSLFVKYIIYPEFNRAWLYNYLFFDYIIGQTTFLKNVFKMPAASYLIFDYNLNKYSLKEYCDIFRSKDKLFKGKEALEYAKEVFSKRVPKYFEGSENIACGLTAGWDGRTNIALAPELSKVTAYTYGIKGCNDLTEARKISEKLNVKFKEINFDEEFLKIFPVLFFETVYQSSGFQGILRATLLHIYKNIQNSGFNLAISGIDYDVLFRGHFGLPSVMFPNMAKIMKTGKLNFDISYWKEIYNNNFLEEFLEEIKSKLNYIVNKFGELNLPASQLSYFLYYGSTNYFGGEIKLANNFTTIRVPGWDNDIIDLAYSIKESSLSFSELAGHKRGQRDEMEVQSYILQKSNRNLSRIPIYNTKAKVVLSGELLFQFYGFYSRSIKKMGRILYNKKKVALENWNYWLNVAHPHLINKLIFTEKSIINEFINYKYLNALKSKQEIYMIGKLATVEIILRLIKNRWEDFGNNY